MTAQAYKPTVAQQVVALVFVALTALLIWYVFFSESPVDKCAKLCAGKNAPQGVKNDCKLACFQIKYYAGDQALEDQIYAYKHPTKAAP